MSIPYHAIAQLGATLKESPGADDLAIILGLKDTDDPHRRDMLSQQGDEGRCLLLLMNLSRLGSRSESEQDSVLSDFSVKFLAPLLCNWRRSEPGSNKYLMYLMMLHNISTNRYFQSYISDVPGAAVDILRHHAENLVAAPWASASMADEYVIFHACQFLNSMLFYEDSKDAIPAALAAQLVAKLETWDRIFSIRCPAVDNNEDNPRIPIRRAAGLARREPKWLLWARPRKLEIQFRKFACNLPGCTVLHTPGTRSLRQCAKCRTARYCSQDHQRQHWNEHKRCCFSFEPGPCTCPEHS